MNPSSTSSHHARRSAAAWLAGLASLFACVSTAGGQEPKARLIRESDPLTPEQEQAKLHVPDGFTVQLFASEPMISKPINMAFDARGRLWVSSTVEYPHAAAKERWADPQGSRVKDSRDAIKILDDTDGDGRADKVTDFADRLNIPSGVLPWHKPEHKDGCIAWSIPNIWYFADTDGDGKCDVREVLFGPLGYERDTHGMCSSFRLGADGWVHATHGFNNTSRFKAKDGSTLDLHSGNVFRFRPDGSRVELYSAGQVNPFGLCWDRRGNLYGADCHSNPVTQLIRGAHYPSFGKPHDGLGFGPVMCEHSHGSTGLCGVAYIDGGIWGPEWDDHILLGNCVTSRVNHDLVTFTGTTPKANERPDFIVSDDLWFRPVDLLLGPDNALYVADFYNRIIGHYEVPLDHPGRDKERGRIWRVVKKDASKQARPAPPPPRAFTLGELASADPFTVRGAAAWFAEHPVKEAVRPLLAALAKADPGDAQLRHQLRVATREALKTGGAYAFDAPVDEAAILDISFAVPTAEAARFLFEHWPPDAARLLAHLARNADESTLDAAIAKARAHPGSSPQARIDALLAVHNGLLEAGRKPPRAFLAWAAELAGILLEQQPGPAHSQLRALATILRTTAPAGLRDKLSPYLPAKAEPLPPAKPQPELDALIAARRAAFAKARPDAAKGAAVFAAHCAVCHAIKGQGGLIGPQLDGVGNRGADRLIEDILDPNRNVDAHFRLHQMKLRDGTMAAGFVRGEVGQVTVLVDAAGNEQRIAKGDIAEDVELPQSLMPPAFAQTIPADAFNDLIAWLLR